MCGIAGIVGVAPNPSRRDAMRPMTRALAHRGPDGESFFDRSPCHFGFRRLAIVDVDAPLPPFSDEAGGIFSICNGEIYNADDLRPALEARGHRFTTRVDTEVLPHLYEEHGPELLAHLDGMFAFAVWDEARGRLLLGRDRAGEKPLFWWTDGRELAFASELRGLLAHPGVARRLDPVALRRFLLHDYFPAPLSPIAGIRKLPAGHLLTWTRGEIRVARYWDLATFMRGDGPGGDGARNRARDGARDRARNSARVARELDGLLGQAVRRRKKSDVPVGVFLSGGVDSSIVLAHLSDQEGAGIPAFSLGHPDPAFDESGYAEATARFFKADFHRLIVDEPELDDGLRRVAAGFDEPLGDASIIPTHLLAIFARQKVKVVLSGEGGDELFAGYPTYLGQRVADVAAAVPARLRGALLAAVHRALPVRMGNNGLDYLLRRFEQGLDLPRVQRHHVWFGSIPPARQQSLLAPRVLEALVGDDPFGSARATLEGRGLDDPLAELLYTDFSMYLQDDLLTKVDRATMLASLEARAPFLDHELAEYAAGLPSSYKIHGRTTKWILREAVRHRLPADVLTRRKRGFTIPFSRWLLQSLREQVRARFAPERVAARGIFDPLAVWTLLEEHLERRADHKKPLFTLLVFDLWCDRVFGDGAFVPLAEPQVAAAASPRAAGAAG